MAQFSLKINGKDLKVDVDPQTPMLWVLRDHLDLVGTKYGCGVAQCGACTVHLNGVATRSCTLPVSSVGNNEITTIEGLSEKWRPPGTKSLVGNRCAAMWILPGRSDHECCGTFEVQPQSYG